MKGNKTFDFCCKDGQVCCDGLVTLIEGVIRAIMVQLVKDEGYAYNNHINIILVVTKLCATYMGECGEVESIARKHAMHKGKDANQLYLAYCSHVK